MANQDPPKDGPASSDDDSDEDAGPDGRRRRFCIERVPEGPPATKPAPKRDRSMVDYDRDSYSRNTGKRRRSGPLETDPRPDFRDHFQRPPHNRHQPDHRAEHRPHQYQPRQHQHPNQYQHQNHPQNQHQQHPHHHHHQQYQHPHQEAKPIEVRPTSVRKSREVKVPIGPVIFINPKMIKKFIGKSIELASVASKSTANATSSIARGSNQDEASQACTLAVKQTSSSAAPTVAKSSAQSSIDAIDLKTSSRESLQAASTMAIIRLVTECIKNDSKRDEKLNKVLVARLIEQLTKHERQSNEREESPLGKHMPERSRNPVSEDYHHHHHHPDSGITHVVGSYELAASGQPIPVIGGSMSGHYNSSKGCQFTSMKQQHHAPYHHHRPRHYSSDRKDSRNLENHQNNKLRNYSR